MNPRISEMLGRQIREFFESDDLSMLKVQVSDLLDAHTDGANKEELQSLLFVLGISLHQMDSRVKLIRQILEAFDD